MVREQVELGYPEWGPPPAPTPTRSSDVQMSPLGGGPGHVQAAGDWSGASPVQYGSGDVQYASTNGNTTQYARAAAAPAGARYAPGGQPIPPAAAGQGQVRMCSASIICCLLVTIWHCRTMQTCVAPYFAESVVPVHAEKAQVALELHTD